VRLPLSWLREHVALPPSLSAREIAAGLVRLGVEVEEIDEVGADLVGPVLVGRVLEFEEFTASNGKTIRWCQVDVGRARAGSSAARATSPPATSSWSRCPAPCCRRVRDHRPADVRARVRRDDLLGPRARPGRRALRIIVLPPDLAPIGTDAVELLHLRDVVFDLETTPDRGYEMSVRGIARELSHAFDAPYADPAAVAVAGAGRRRLAGADRGPGRLRPVLGPDGHRARPGRTDPAGDPAPARAVRHPVDLAGRRRHELRDAGDRQPMHAFDRARLTGPITVRRARPGETLETLDGVLRTLDPDDLLVTDESGPIALAGIMGGAATEIGPETTDVVLEAAHWQPATISRGIRRHKLPSEASKRFERGVDPLVAGPALARACALLASLGGRTSTMG
jgi:phenylalanyl-tRNA synthetase beta chain